MAPEKPASSLFLDMVKDWDLQPGQQFSRQNVVEWFEQNHPHTSGKTIMSKLVRFSTNDPQRVKYNVRPGVDDRFFKIDNDHFRLYDPQNDPMPIYFDPERIAYWFFRLNGCLILDNFLVHHPKRGIDGTDIDILGIRFPHRRELANSEIPTTEPMIDHELFETEEELIDICFVEVKRDRINLNKSWKEPEKGNIERLLYAIGPFPEDLVEDIANELYRLHSYTDNTYRVRIIAVGDHKHYELPDSVTVLYWPGILTFIYQRLNVYYNQKSMHDQWDWTGRQLFSLMQSCRSPDSEQWFVEKVLEQM